MVWGVNPPIIFGVYPPNKGGVYPEINWGVYPEINWGVYPEINWGVYPEIGIRFEGLTTSQNRARPPCLCEWKRPCCLGDASPGE